MISLQEMAGSKSLYVYHVVIFCLKNITIEYLWFLLLSPPAKYSIVTSQYMQFTFGDKREVYLLDESAPPVTEKESMREEKRSISPRTKYGHAKLS